MRNQVVAVTHTGDRFEVDGYSCDDIATVCSRFRSAPIFEFLVDAEAVMRVLCDVALAGLFVGSSEPAALKTLRSDAGPSGPEQLVVLIAVRRECVELLAEVVK